MVIPFWNRKVSSAIIDVVLLLVLLDVLEILHYPVVAVSDCFMAECFTLVDLEAPFVSCLLKPAFGD